MQRPDRSKEWIAPETKYLPFPCKLNPAWAVLPFHSLGMSWAHGRHRAQQLRRCPSCTFPTRKSSASCTPGSFMAEMCMMDRWHALGMKFDRSFFCKFHKVRHLTDQHARDKVSARLFLKESCAEKSDDLVLALFGARLLQNV